VGVPWRAYAKLTGRIIGLQLAVSDVGQKRHIASTQVNEIHEDNMNKMIASAAFTAVLALPLAAGAAQASDKCAVPRAEWQPQQVLQQKLEGEGWNIRKIKVDDGCYEVYGTDASGRRMEAYFDPKTFTVMKSKQES
jgi:hypothetical protein